MPRGIMHGMTSGTIIVKGIVRGRTIELEEEPGLPTGQPVSVVLRPALPPGEGLRRAFGSWADSPVELNRFLSELDRDRQDDRSESAP